MIDFATVVFEAIGARTQYCDTYEDSFDLSVDPSDSMPISIASGPTRSSATYARVWAPVVLYVERAALDDSGQVLVLGWAVSLAAMVTVQVFLNEERISAAQLGGLDVVLDGQFRGLYNRNGFIHGTGYLVPDEVMAGIRVEESRLVSAAPIGRLLWAAKPPIPITSIGSHKRSPPSITRSIASARREA